MKITEETFFKELREGILYPIYIFEGEPFFVEDAWKEFTTEIERLAGKDRVLKKRLSPRDVDESELLEFLLSPPLGFLKKTVWLYDLKGSGRNLIKLLIRIIERPNSSMYLVISPIGDQKTVNAIVEIAQKSTVVPYVKFSSPKSYQLPRWIQNRLKKMGKNISLEGAKYIAEIVGVDFYILDRELEKLTVAVERDNITLEDISVFVAGAHISSPFEIMDCIASGNLSRALLKLTELLEAGEQPIALLGLLSRHVKLLWQIKSAEEELINIDEIKSFLNIPDFLISRLREQSHAFSVDQLRFIHRKLYEADIKLKTSSVPPIYVLSSALMSFFLNKKANRRG